MINKNEKYCCFFDWDGTLCSGPRMSEANKAALAKLKAAGHYIFINTGRARAFIPDEAFDGIEWDGVIAGSAYVEMHGEILVNEYVPLEALAYAKKLYDETGIRCLFEGAENCYVIGNSSTGFEHIEDTYDEFLARGADELQITKINVGADLNDYPEYKFPGCWTICFKGYTEVVLDGFDKSTGIKLISEKLGIPRERCIGFGDSANDLDMLKYTGISVIMAKAPEFLDEYATIRATEHETGVAECINKLFFE